MKLLISTPHFILNYDVEQKKISILESGQGEYYGITWNPSGIDLALSYSGIGHESLVDLATYANSEKGWISVGGQQSWPFLSAPHQILQIDNDTILATNTGRNALARVSVKDFSIIQYRYDDVLWDRLTPQGREGAHFNSIFFRNSIVYLTAHNFEKGSYVLELAWPTLEKIRQHYLPTTGVHNFWITNEEQWLTCDSNSGSLVDAQTGEWLWTNHGQGFTRGLAATDKIIFIGNSEMAARRDIRTNSESGLWIVDRRTWRTLDYISLGHFGGVHEVRLIDVPDLCHHGASLSSNALLILDRSRKILRESRLSAASKSYLDRHRWNMVAGVDPVVDGKGWIFLELDTFAMAILKGYVALNGCIIATLSVNKSSPNDHASLIARYKGPNDTNMYAALFQNTHAGLLASIWVNNGDWKQITNQPIPTEWGLIQSDRSYEFSVEFELVGPQLVLRVAGNQLLAISDATLNHSGNFGIRLFGSSFRIRDVQFTAIELTHS